MRIEVDNHRKVFAIKEDLNTAFPDLKIEFYEKPSKPGGSPSKKIAGSKALTDCRAVHNSGTISIGSGMTVGELRQNFSDVYGLSVEVFQNHDSSYEGTPVNEKTILAETTT